MSGGGVLFSGERVRAESLSSGVVRLLLVRGELRNAFDGRMIQEISDCLDGLAKLSPAQLRVLLLEGEGKVFCAGADLAHMAAQAVAPLEVNLAEARNLGSMFHRLAAFPAPVLCVVQGAAIGGGFGLAACADLVLAEFAAIFATTEVRLGIVPGVISPYLIRRLGLSQATPLMLSGSRISAAEAHRIGLVHHLVPEGGSLEGARELLLHELLQAGPEAARRTKGLLLRAHPLPDEDWREWTVQAIAEARQGAEGQTGLRVFLEKSQAPWIPKREDRA